MSVYQTFTNELDIQFIIKDNVIWIPADELNTDYRKYLAWVAEGNTAEEWNPDAPPVEETTVESENP